MSENMYDAWDNGDRHEIRQQFARREEILKLASDIGMGWWLDDGKLEQFAALVAAQEREALVRQTDTRKGERMTDRELMQQALEALVDAQLHNYALKHKETDDLIAALRERLEQPEQAWITAGPHTAPLRTHWEGCEEVHPECREKNV